MSYLHIAYSCLVEYLLYVALVGVLHLDDNTRILCEEQLDGVFLVDAVEVCSYTALLVGEAHLEKGSDETSCADVVSCKDEFLVDEGLDGHEGVAEVFWVLDCGHIAAYLAKSLGEG